VRRVTQSEVSEVVEVGEREAHEELTAPQEDAQGLDAQGLDDQGLDDQGLDAQLSAQKEVFLSRYHHAMLTLGLLVTLLTRLEGWLLELTALWSVHALMWVNVLLLARGLEGLLTRRRAVAGLILLQLITQLVGAWLLVALFPNATAALFVGASLWVIALLYASVERISA